MPSLEEITYDIGRASLAEQEAFVRDIRQRTGTLLAAQAVVASFLGGSALQRAPLSVFGWLAIASLVAAVVAGAAALAPWRTSFSLDARTAYRSMRVEVAADGIDGREEWLLSAAFLYRATRRSNRPAVRRIVFLSAALSPLLIVQTALWIGELAIR